MNVTSNKTRTILTYAAAITVAVASFVGALYLWYRALTPEEEQVRVIPVSRVSPDAFSAGLEGNLRRIIEPLGIPEKDFRRREPEPTQKNITSVYSVRVPQNVSLAILNLRISGMAESMGGQVIRGVEGNNGDTLTLTLGVGPRETDIVVISKSRPAVEKKVKISVVIDDLGIKDLAYAKRLIDLDQVVTLSILPFQRHTADVIDMARASDTPYILHMPMEPKSDLVSPGEGAIYLVDDASTMKNKLEKAFNSVRDAKGFNNHMGSLLTEDVRTMECVMSYLRERGYFFLDSQTSRQSKGYEISQREGIKSAKISGYLDAVNDPDHIQKRLTALVEGAFRTGSAIILGHDRPETIAILEKELPRIEQLGVEFIPIADIVK